MDSLGGILTKGLLGNPILARFRLFVDIIFEDITPTPTPSGTPVPTPTPTVTQTPPPNPAWGGGGGHGVMYRDVEDDKPKKRTVKITIAFKSKEYSSTHTISDGILKVVINMIKRANIVKDKISATVKFRKNNDTSVKVKMRDD